MNIKWFTKVVLLFPFYRLRDLGIKNGRNGLHKSTQLSVYRAGDRLQPRACTATLHMKKTGITKWMLRMHDNNEISSLPLSFPRLAGLEMV